ncbi:MAG: hypothetical protein ACKO2C_04330 [Actinomycetes bacterium]
MAHTHAPTTRRRAASLTLALLPAAFALALPLTAGAATSPVSSTWRGVDPTAYDHSTGGGYWSDGQSSLTPYATAWTCGDVISYLLRLDVRNGVPTTAAKVSIQMTSDATGQSGIALIPIANGASIDAADPAQSGNADSAITDFAAVTSGTPLSSGATSSVGFTVTNLDAGESVVVRVDLRIVCNDTNTATGNVQASLTSVTSIDGAVSYLSGAQTIPAKKALPGGTTTTTVPPTTTTAPPVTTTTAPPVTTTTAPPVTTTTAPPVTTTTAPPVTTTTSPGGGGTDGEVDPTTTTTNVPVVIPDPKDPVTTTVPSGSSTTLATEVLGEQIARTTSTGGVLASTGGSLRLALLGLSAISIGTWFVAAARRRRTAEI